MPKTNNYEIFGILEMNRELNEGPVLGLMKSIQLKNMLERRPILVNKKMEVIDGQHRLEAAKRLGVDIFYEIDPKASVEDMLTLNENSRNWGVPDYLNYYCQKGVEDYIKLREFVKKYNLSPSSAIKLLGKGGGGGQRGKIGFRGSSGRVLSSTLSTERKKSPYFWIEAVT